MEILTTVTTAKSKMYSIAATFELCKTVKKNVEVRSADKRAGNYKTDVYADVVFITVNDEKRYFMHTTDINDAVKAFEAGEWRIFLPKLF